MKICLTRFSDPAKSQDPRLQGCPLIGCSSGFGTLCGYTMEDIVGRTANMNCWNHLNEFQMTSNIGVKISMIIWFQEFVDQVVCLFWGTQGNLTSSILRCVWVCLKKIKQKFSPNDSLVDQELSVSGGSGPSREDRFQDAKTRQGFVLGENTGEAGAFLVEGDLTWFIVYFKHFWN